MKAKTVRVTLGVDLGSAVLPLICRKDVPKGVVALVTPQGIVARPAMARVPGSFDYDPAEGPYLWLTPDATVTPSILEWTVKVIREAFIAPGLAPAC